MKDELELRARELLDSALAKYQEQHPNERFRYLVPKSVAHETIVTALSISVGGGVVVGEQGVTEQSSGGPSGNPLSPSGSSPQAVSPASPLQIGRRERVMMLRALWCRLAHRPHIYPRPLWNGRRERWMLWCHRCVEWRGNFGNDHDRQPEGPSWLTNGR